MAHWKDKLTPKIIVAAVLVFGLLTVGSAAWLQGAPGDEGDGVEAEVVASLKTDGTTEERASDRPNILPMPPRVSEEETVGEGSAARGGVLGGAPDGERVEEGGIVEGMPEGGLSVRPGVSRQRLASLVADVLDADVTGMPLGDSITRADVARAVVAALGLEDVASLHRPLEPIFRDVPPEHDAFEAVAMMERLGLYPFHVGTLFVPDEPVQWAEVKFTVELAAELESIAGPVVHVNAPARTVSVEWTPRHTTAYVADDGALIVRNGEIVSLERLRAGDDVYGFADVEGQLFVLVAEGDGGVDGVSEEVMALIRELATPEQLAAIIRRDWDRAAMELRGSVYNQLLARGATPEEAEALLAKDWAVVEAHGKERLTELISDTTDVDGELVRAVLDGDWDTALGFIEVEVLEYVLNHLAV